MSLTILIVAAGGSTRLGKPKQLVSLGGKPLLQNCIDRCVGQGPDVYCVLGANAVQIRRSVSSDYCRFIYNPAWQDGLSRSIACGVLHLPKETAAVLIVLADQWALTEEDIQRLIAEYRQAPNNIHTSLYQGHFGAPTIFPQDCFDALKSLPPGEQGAKQLLKRYRLKVNPVPMSNAAMDLDTPEQLRQLKSMELSYGYSLN